MSTKNKQERGQSMIEFALTLALLLMLLAGLVDLGRAIFTYMALREAAQEGALYGSINPILTDSIEDRVMGSSNVLQILAEEEPLEAASVEMAALSPLALEAAQSSVIDVTVTHIGTPCSGNGIRVDVEYTQFPLTMPFLGTVLGTQSVTIRASATDTILTPPCN